MEERAAVGRGVWWFAGAVVGLLALVVVAANYSGMAPQPIVTLTKYNALRPGTLAVDVGKIVGVPGTEKGRSDIGGLHTVIVTWENRDGSKMELTFQNDKLVSKTQVGLR